VETGGLNPKKSALLQLAGIIEIDGKEECDFNYLIAPFDDDEIVQKALEVNGFSMEQVKKFTSPEKSYNQFVKLLDSYVSKYNKQDKFFFVGYNSHSFDMPFVRTFFTKNKNKFFGSYFHYPSLDVMILALEELKEERPRMKNFKLSTVAKEMGIELEEASLHDALYDIKLTREIYKRI
jgi:DNA polymerase-3 subunit epsilon